MDNRVIKTVGIMGGMGPMATSDLIYNIISQTDAECDAEHVHLLIDCDGSIPDRTRAILGDGESPLPKLCTMAKKLEYMGADIIAISCNTSHYFYNEISEAVEVPVLNMIDETAREVARAGHKRVLLLATDGTVQMGLYEKALAKYGVKTVYPTENGQKKVMQLIYECVKSGHYEFDVQGFCEDIRAFGNMPVLLGCTELPIAFKHFGIDEFELVDPSKILARAIIREAGARVK